ncbi:Gfo/Idh/MocA family oxidoreductase [Shinella sp. S4-D37]|uniref:Gfo/Idh/MocA family protein n=1 Tax=Shinella sp. S4-D37 TaxID=3161999 RepID=UPI0034666F8D
MSRLRVALIGTGYFSQYHYDAWSRIPEVEMVGVAYMSSRAKAQGVADQYGIGFVGDDVEVMLDTVGPDIVDIISPPETHLPYARLAHARGIHAISQKPLAPSLAEARQLADLSRSGGGRVVVHENWRFKPWFRELRRLLDAGVLGEVYNATFRMRPGDGQGPKAYLDRQPYFQKMTRFLIHETGIHMIDVFRFMFGEIDAVTARLRRLNPAIAGEDAGYVMMDFRTGLAGMLDANRLVDFDASNPRLTMGEMLIEGEKGQLRLDGCGRIVMRPHRGEAHAHSYAWFDRGYSGDCVHALQRHVVDHLLNGSRLENRAEDYVRNMEIEAAVYRSDAERKTIFIDREIEPEAA